MKFDHPKQKVQASHLARMAYVYVRQSTLRQVFENTESARRQYDLKGQAVALGWPSEQVVVIDEDQGQSGASVVGRGGFQRLVAEVGMGRVGIVLGLEVSRLARKSSDWHRLLEICALTDTLILDEDGLYDPAQFNDRLVLGLKGTMSEAELHVLRARLIGGIRSKARRGELRTRLPVGFVYDEQGQVVLHPDQQIQQTVRTFFATFRRTASASATVKAFRNQQLLFPRALYGGPRKGEIIWKDLGHGMALRVLKNPRYAGAFVFGRTRWRNKQTRGPGWCTRLPQEEWLSLIPDSHPGYISWQQYEQNQEQLRRNSAAYGQERRSAPREGPALLQGLVICGRCGRRMTIRYHVRKAIRIPDYVCQSAGIESAQAPCQTFKGQGLDGAIGALLLKTMTPHALELALAVQQEMGNRLEEADRLRRLHVERARIDADAAQRRYMRVDPDNRLVAETLEGAWNEKLRALRCAQEDRQRKHQEDCRGISEEQRAAVLSLSKDLPKLWNDANTPARERKRVARLLIEDITLHRNPNTYTAHVRFKGGATTTIDVPRPLSAGLLRKTSTEVIETINELLDNHTDGEAAVILNNKGLRSGLDKAFTRRIVANIRRAYKLKSRFERLREAGMLTRAELAKELEIPMPTLRAWRQSGLLQSHRADERTVLYERPEHELLTQNRQIHSNHAHEVQCEA